VGAYLTQRVTRVLSVSDQSLVLVENTSNVTYAADGEGRRWVRKHVTNTGAQPMLAEILGWLLARELGIPVPDGAVAGTGNDVSWLSSYVADVTHWEPARAHLITNLDGLGGALALDAIILNADRHAGNILLQTIDPHHVVAWAIDHENATIGHPQDFARSPNHIPSTANVARGLPVELLEPGARDAAVAAANLPGWLLAEIVAEACDITGERGGAVLTQALGARMAEAPRLTNAYLIALGEAP
jgi:hypothetical protein